VKVFSEQHEMFRATVRAFVEKEVSPHVEEWEAAGRMPKALWRRMGEVGFFGLEYDEKYGGSGADVLMSVVLHEECARSRSGSFAMAVGVHCDMASPHLYWTGSEALKEKYLPGVSVPVLRRLSALHARRYVFAKSGDWQSYWSDSRNRARPRKWPAGESGLVGRDLPGNHGTHWQPDLPSPPRRKRGQKGRRDDPRAGMA
jgi:hypothetical protein